VNLIAIADPAMVFAPACLANKFARATVPAHFFLAALVAIGCEVVKLEDI
jgi:hypothetical protein